MLVPCAERNIVGIIIIKAFYRWLTAIQEPGGTSVSEDPGLCIPRGLLAIYYIESGSVSLNLSLYLLCTILFLIVLNSTEADQSTSKWVGRQMLRCVIIEALGQKKSARTFSKSFWPVNLAAIKLILGCILCFFPIVGRFLNANFQYMVLDFYSLYAFL